MDKLGKILIVDDDRLVLEALHETFLDFYDVLIAESGETGLKLVAEHKDLNCAVLDIRMAEMDGLQTAEAIRKIRPALPIIFNTGYPGDYSEAEVNGRHRPFDYITKNERPEKLIHSVRDAVTFHRFQTDPHALTSHARREYNMVGHSPAMLRIYETIERIGKTGSKAMILGPTGSGKELVARAIHRRSRRAHKQLAILNCNHKAADLVESELFGHLKGAFTSAVRDQIGMVEYAHGGTLFLDEIGNLDHTTQEKLLRVLETGEMHRVGSTETIQVDIRVICATNSCLEDMVAEGTFREDLYYRLGGVQIVLPPLRDRREDILELVDLFNNSYCEKYDTPLRIFTPKAIKLLVEFDWPGNVRQLCDTVQSLIDLSHSELVTRHDVSEFLNFKGCGVPDKGTMKERVREFKKLVLIQAMAEHKGNVAAASRALSLDKSNLRKMLKDHDLA
jgi:two-component system response regulator AtoC